MSSNPFYCCFYSYKGGVGRTSAAVNCAKMLAERGKRVLLLDFDLAAPGVDIFDVSKEAHPMYPSYSPLRNIYYHSNKSTRTGLAREELIKTSRGKMRETLIDVNLKKNGSVSVGKQQAKLRDLMPLGFIEWMKKYGGSSDITANGPTNIGGDKPPNPPTLDDYLRSFNSSDKFIGYSQVSAEGASTKSGSIKLQSNLFAYKWNRHSQMHGDLLVMRAGNYDAEDYHSSAYGEFNLKDYDPFLDQPYALRSWVAANNKSFFAGVTSDEDAKSSYINLLDAADYRLSKEKSGETTSLKFSKNEVNYAKALKKIGENKGYKSPSDWREWQKLEQQFTKEPEAVAKFKSYVADELEADYVLIDCRPGFSDEPRFALKWFGEAIVFAFNLNEWNMQGVIQSYEEVLHTGIGRAGGIPYIMLLASPIPMSAEQFTNYASAQEKIDSTFVRAVNRSSRSIYGGPVEVPYNNMMLLKDILVSDEAPNDICCEKYNRLVDLLMAGNPKESANIANRIIGDGNFATVVFRFQQTILDEDSVSLRLELLRYLEQFCEQQRYIVDVGASNVHVSLKEAFERGREQYEAIFSSERERIEDNELSPIYLGAVYYFIRICYAWLENIEQRIVNFEKISANSFALAKDSANSKKQTADSNKGLAAHKKSVLVSLREVLLAAEHWKAEFSPEVLVSGEKSDHEAQIIDIFNATSQNTDRLWKAASEESKNVLTNYANLRVTLDQFRKEFERSSSSNSFASKSRVGSELARARCCLAPSVYRGDATNNYVTLEQSDDDAYLQSGYYLLWGIYTPEPATRILDAAVLLQREAYNWQINCPERRDAYFKLDALACANLMHSPTSSMALQKQRFISAVRYAIRRTLSVDGPLMPLPETSSSASLNLRYDLTCPSFACAGMRTPEWSLAPPSSGWEDRQYPWRPNASQEQMNLLLSKEADSDLYANVVGEDCGIVLDESALSEANRFWGDVRDSNDSLIEYCDGIRMLVQMVLSSKSDAPAQQLFDSATLSDRFFTPAYIMAAICRACNIAKIYKASKADENTGQPPKSIDTSYLFNLRREAFYCLEHAIDLAKAELVAMEAVVDAAQRAALASAFYFDQDDVSKIEQHFFDFAEFLSHKIMGYNLIPVCLAAYDVEYDTACDAIQIESYAEQPDVANTGGPSGPSAKKSEEAEPFKATAKEFMDLIAKTLKYPK